MSRFILGLAALALVAGAGQAKAGLLLDLEDPAFLPFPGTSYSPSFIADATDTTITFAGYDIPATIIAADISLAATGGGPNLLGSTWTFTPAPSGSDAGQSKDGFGTGTNSLSFSGTSEDNFDRFSQVVATVPGQSYTLDFDYIEVFSLVNTPSELLVSETDVTAPEPSTLAMSSLLLGIFGIAGLRKRMKLAPADGPKVNIGPETSPAAQFWKELESK
jgi:hypothetical protein